jgi:hypothetical protein
MEITLTALQIAQIVAYPLTLFLVPLVALIPVVIISRLW